MRTFASRSLDKWIVGVLLVGHALHLDFFWDCPRGKIYSDNHCYVFLAEISAESILFVALPNPEFKIALDFAAVSVRPQFAFRFCSYFV